MTPANKPSPWQEPVVVTGDSAFTPLFAGMRHEEFAEFAALNPPPQEWWDEDVSGLRKPRSN